MGQMLHGWMDGWTDGRTDGRTNMNSGFDPQMAFGRGNPLEYKLQKLCTMLVDLRSGFGRRMQRLQVYRSGSMRSVFISNKQTAIK